MIWTLLTGRIGIALGAAVAAGALSAWGAASFLGATHDAEIQSIRAEAAEQYATAQQQAIEVERAHADLATKLEVQHETNRQQLAAMRADNRRLARDLGGLRDPFAVAPACPVSTAPDGTVDHAVTAPVGRLSDEATQFLLGFAYDADRAAEYASTCYQWVKELKELQ